MARPRQYGEPADMLIRVRVTRQQRAELATVSRETGRPVSSMIREAVNSYVADYREVVPFRRTKPGGTT